MPSDLRTFVARDLRLHPRVAYQGLFCGEDVAAELASDLPPMPPFRGDYFGAISVIDWDHRLPSRSLLLRIYAYYSADSHEAGEAAYDERLEEIGVHDKFPEFDVPDFDRLAADEAYAVEIDLDGRIGRCELTSAWRRAVDPSDAQAAVTLARGSREFARLVAEHRNRPSHLGELEAVSWTPPCESQHHQWTLDVWYLLSFDGRVGTGRSFLVDLDTKDIVSVRDFSVRTG
ncbi:hypothetical protein [Haliangium sp.]|uniref:hypothetical protein n=1 Tax=Haliangium sp. TaxID=2663208 RepID=UPI003D129ACE